MQLNLKVNGKKLKRLLEKKVEDLLSMLSNLYLFNLQKSLSA